MNAPYEIENRLAVIQCPVKNCKHGPTSGGRPVVIITSVDGAVDRVQVEMPYWASLDWSSQPASGPRLLRAPNDPALGSSPYLRYIATEIHFLDDLPSKQFFAPCTRHGDITVEGSEVRDAAVHGMKAARRPYRTHARARPQPMPDVTKDLAAGLEQRPDIVRMWDASARIFEEVLPQAVSSDYDAIHQLVINHSASALLDPKAVGRLVRAVYKTITHHG
jgi:hypothetical protein